jgi:hypothetical protein
VCHTSSLFVPGGGSGGSGKGDGLKTGSGTGGGTDLELRGGKGIGSAANSGSGSGGSSEFDGLRKSDNGSGDFIQLLLNSISSSLKTDA